MKHFLSLFLLASFLLTGCSVERLLSKAQIFIKGSPPVQVMTEPDPSGPMPADMDPMKYSTILTQYVEEAFKLEGFNVTYLDMGENFQPQGSGQFLVEVMMAMIEQQPPLMPDPENPAMMALKVNLSSMMAMIDKEGNPEMRDYQQNFEMSPAEQAEAIGADPQADINKLILQKAAEKLAGVAKEDLTKHLKENKKGI